MVDGNIKIKLSLKEVAKELAELAGTTDTMVYDDFNKIYYINGLTEDLLLKSNFKLHTYNSNKAPIYKRENIYAEKNTSSNSGDIMVYKIENDKWVGEE